MRAGIFPVVDLENKHDLLSIKNSYDVSLVASTFYHFTINFPSLETYGYFASKIDLQEF